MFKYLKTIEHLNNVKCQQYACRTHDLYIRLKDMLIGGNVLWVSGTATELMKYRNVPICNNRHDEISGLLDWQVLAV